jgi:hypothetical protein
MMKRIRDYVDSKPVGVASPGVSVPVSPVL